MKKISLAFFLMGILLCNPRSHAQMAPMGNEIGNGGGILQCKTDDGKTYVKFFDEFEAEFRYEYGIVPPKTNSNDVKVIALAYLERLKSHDPKLFATAAGYLREFNNEALYLTHEYIITVPDVGFGVIPKNCSYIQLVIQKNPTYPNDERYWINFEHWKMLNSQQQAMVLVHEVLFRRAREVTSNMPSSEGLRHFVALIISQQISVITDEGYLKWKKLAGLTQSK